MPGSIFDKLKNKNFLTNIEYNRVDLVKDGANTASHIKFFKGGHGMPKFQEFLGTLEEEHKKLVEDALAKARTEIPEEKQTELDDITKAKNAAEDKVKALEEEVAELKKSAGDNTEEEVLKSLDPAAKALVEGLIQKSAANEAIIAKMAEEKRKEDHISKAKSLGNLSAKAEELASIFDEIGKSAPASVDKIYGVLQAANNLIKDNQVMFEKGTTTSFDGDASEAEAKLDAKAQEIQKSRKMSYEAAYAQALDENPELYEAYSAALME